MGKKRVKKVMLIGWDAADWKVIQPLINAGKMPALASLIEEGTWGNLATLDPPLSPMLWTSIATGVRADKHGILGFIEPNPDNTGVRPVSSTSRKVKAIWNILNQEDYKSNVVAWWPSNPAEPINGVMVSNFFQQEKGKLDEPWPMAPGTVHPKRLEETMASMRIHPNELTFAHIMPFIPKANEVNQDEDKRVLAAARFLAHCSTLHAASTYLQVNEEWDFMAVYHDAIDHFCHGFMKFHPPQLNGVPDDLYDKYKQVITGAYVYHDMMLERTLKLLDDDTTVILISDHGFHSDHLRPMALPKEPAAPAHEHSPLGVFVAKGPGIKKGGRVFGASVLDITPTLLALYGLPVGKDMEGKVLSQAFEEEWEPDFIDSWENVEGNHGMHPADLKEDTWAAQEAMQQLVDLGYVEAPDEDVATSIRKAKNESQYYLARNYLNAQKYEEAIQILEGLIEDNIEEARYGMSLAMAYLTTRQYQKCRNVVNQLRDKLEGYRSFLDYLEGSLFLASNRPRKALEYLNRAMEQAPKSVDTLLQVGRALNTCQMWAESEEAFRRAIDVDAENSAAHHGLAISLMRRGQYEEAVDELLAAVEVRYFFPQAHYHLGETLVLMKEYEHASHAFQVAISLAPGLTKAHKWLVKLYEEHLGQPEKANEHREFLAKNIKGVITIVSGLPRSGTSMMMQMLEAGGMDIMTDRVREADNSNPKGYYEYEPVKSIIRDNSWLSEAPGKALKVVAPLLQHLSADYEYRIVFMERDLTEILRSQQIMLGKTKAEAEAFPVMLADAFKKQMEQAKAWIERTPNAEVLFISHAEALQNPSEVAENVASFLGSGLDISKMQTVVDPSLHRNKLVKS